MKTSQPLDGCQSPSVTRAKPKGLQRRRASHTLLWAFLLSLVSLQANIHVNSPPQQAKDTTNGLRENIRNHWNLAVADVHHGASAPGDPPLARFYGTRCLVSRAWPAGCSSKGWHRGEKWKSESKVGENGSWFVYRWNGREKRGFNSKAAPFHFTFTRSSNTIIKGV